MFYLTRGKCLLISLALLLAGCIQTPSIRRDHGFNPAQARETIYIVPFDATLVPPDFGEPLFNEFVDILNDQRRTTKVGRFVILKEDLKDVEPSWLIKQTYLSGDVWGFVEDAGCCSSELKVKSRLYVYDQGRNEPVLEIYLPVEDFFEYDRTTLDEAKRRLSKKLARDLAGLVIGHLTPKP